MSPPPRSSSPTARWATAASSAAVAGALAPPPRPTNRAIHLLPTANEAPVPRDRCLVCLTQLFRLASSAMSKQQHSPQIHRHADQHQSTHAPGRVRAEANRGKYDQQRDEVQRVAIAELHIANAV